MTVVEEVDFSMVRMPFFRALLAPTDSRDLKDGVSGTANRASFARNSAFSVARRCLV